MPEHLPRVVIVGGGFGDLAAAKALRRTPVDVSLIDRTDHHLYIVKRIASSSAYIREWIMGERAKKAGRNYFFRTFNSGLF
jgi:NADH dehydrogenase FAD-containing subunit